MPLPKVTTRAPSSSLVSTTKPGTSRWCSAPTSRSAAQAVSGRASIWISLRIEAIASSFVDAETLEGSGRCDLEKIARRRCLTIQTPMRSAGAPEAEGTARSHLLGGCHLGQHLDDELLLAPLHAGCESPNRIVGKNRNATLRDHRARVVLGVDEVDRDPA